ncbi:hypothetical protein KBY82_03255 [Cyanobium sp. AMD-g]|uniref:hypothetical protein n=1 Tax=Cyanobium sp. AMD-g TaxID=2823699 RepID=UPI0020CE9FAF|nr:hypothetical protein [Cyanobium sp. AMD-g]MCP9929794.1 hypothetical protein [Cyanobium sp. AMD-g]
MSVASKVISFLSIAALSSALSAAPAKAIGVVDPGLISFTPCLNNCANPGFQGTVGWDFRVNAPRTINQLGVYDSNANGLAFPTQVGLWNRSAGGSLLATATVPGGTLGTLLGQFRYVGITSLTLLPGVTYALGAQYSVPFSPDAFQGALTGSSSFAPWISYFGGTYVGAGSLSLPTVTNQPVSFYGPNIASTSTPLSVPGPLPILGVIAVARFSRKLRQRKKSLA